MDKIVYIIVFFLSKITPRFLFPFGNFVPIAASFCMKKKSDLPVGVSLTNFDIL